MALTIQMMNKIREKEFQEKVSDSYVLLKIL
jgi:hypothetical protein